MSAKEKIESAKSTNWLTEGLTNTEVKDIVDDAKKCLNLFRKFKNDNLSLEDMYAMYDILFYENSDKKLDGYPFDDPNAIDKYTNIIEENNLDMDTIITIIDCYGAAL